MSSIGFVGVNRILSKFSRDIDGDNIKEGDTIEWIGEALEFLRVPSLQTQAVYFAEVENYETDFPIGLHKVRMIARHINWTKKEKCAWPKETVEEVKNTPSCMETFCDAGRYFPYVDMNWQYIDWARNPFFIENFRYVTLSNNAFFNTIVCKDEIPYENCGDEYTIVGTTDRKFRFSFKEGYIALAYYKNEVDEDGYPLIPDNISYITAITHYLAWKIAQKYSWRGREGYSGLARDSERLWIKYSRQGKNFAKMQASEGKVFNSPK